MIRFGLGWLLTITYKRDWLRLRLWLLDNEIGICTPRLPEGSPIPILFNKNRKGATPRLPERSPIPVLFWSKHA